jgi:hypothetical protein
LLQRCPSSLEAPSRIRWSHAGGRADEDAIYCNEPADVVVGRIEASDEARFIQVTLAPYGKADPPRTAYVSPGEVTAVLPTHQLELEAMVEDPPDWYHE